MYLYEKNIDYAPAYIYLTTYIITFSLNLPIRG